MVEEDIVQEVLLDQEVLVLVLVIPLQVQQQQIQVVVVVEQEILEIRDNMQEEMVDLV